MFPSTLRSVSPVRRRLLVAASIVLFLTSLLPAAAATPLSPIAPRSVLASHTPNPTSVTVAGSLQSELGCSGDWQPDCAATHLAYDSNDDVWQRAFDIPTGSYEYKAALNNSWDENYGAGAVSNGPNIPLSLGSNGSVKFYYDHKSHWITSNANSTIAVAPGSFQSELGCSADWDPACLRSWLQDPDGDGTYVFVTSSIPAGNYESKVAINESWDENYGLGGVQSGDNIPFTVPASGSTTTFSYNSTSHVLTITSVPPVGHAHDNNIEWVGLKHDSRDTLYRSPGGAVPAGTPVMIRLRTFANDVTAVSVRFYSVDLNGQQVVPMSPAAVDVSCYDEALVDDSCDFWQATLPASWGEDNLWYRFIVTDGSDTDYYADNTAAFDGGLGAATDDPVDQSWALMLFDPAFTAPSWAKDAVIYQIFPDRFRNGRKDNDPKTGDVRYDDPVIKLGWGILPEGYCRNYADANATTCPARFGGTGTEGPRGRDYFGGDLKGVDQELDYLQALGITTIYFNPIFDAGSNHSYDTQDYTKVDPYFGSQKDWESLVKHAKTRGINVVLDGVFNHLSSDSPIFDRYHHYATVGACESKDSAYRAWFYFHDVTAGTGNCASSAGVANGATYDGWFGFDSIPVIRKSESDVQAFFLTSADSVTKRWLRAGAAGWRLDVMGDASFPTGYWETFREAAKSTKADALIVGELWQKDSTLLRFLRGDRADTTMNYRLRDAVIAFLAPGGFDSKGFGDSGHVISATEFANRLASIREDYPDAAYYSLMNLLDSHDTERLLWTLTPGAETTADKELNAGNVAAGKRRLELASLVQFTMAGSPTVYYGDEVGVTGDDDPDDRRTYPWADLGGSPDTSLLSWYQGLTSLRSELAPLTDGDFQVLGVQGADAVAYGRKTGSAAAIVALNRSGASASLMIPVAGYLPNGVAFTTRLAVGSGGAAGATTAGGSLVVTVPANGALLLATGPSIDLTPPSAPVLSLTGEGNGSLSVSWTAVAGATGYDVYSSPLSGGGYIKANVAPVVGTTFEVTGLANARPTYIVVRALDAAGNASANSNEVAGIPHYTIGWANLQWPPSMIHTIDVYDRTDNAYGQVWIDGVTNQPGRAPTLRAQLGFGPDGSNPTGAGWTWVEATFNVDAGNNDEYVASMLPEAVGSYDYVYRYSVTDGRDWLYADQNGPIAGGALPPNPGNLSVVSSGDTTPPSAPTGLVVVSASPAGIELNWDAVGDAALYEVQRSAVSGGPYAPIVRTSTPGYTDPSVVEGATYYYVVLAIDQSFNRSAPSSEVSATAELRTVTITFNVTVPASTDGTGRPVTIAGTLSRLDGGYPDWTPGVVELTRIDATHWRFIATTLESTALEYKYVIASDVGDAWAYVEKDATCSEIGNRLLTVSYGLNGTQTVNDTVLNWRNIAPCGN
jgi:glycosidase